jgi:hypothetical protein
VPDKTKLNDPYEGLIEPIVFEEFDMLKNISSIVLKKRVKNYNIIEENMEKLEAAINNFIAHANTMGIYSLSKNYNNELLWAHYSNSHKGFCMEFNLAELMDLYYQTSKDTNFVNLINVEYGKTTPKLIINDVTKKIVKKLLQRYWAQNLWHGNTKTKSDWYSKALEKST